MVQKQQEKMFCRLDNLQAKHFSRFDTLCAFFMGVL